MRRSLASAAADLGAAQRLLTARQRELDQLRGALTATLQTLREQLQRVEGSAAWRYGHAATRSLARARGRRTTTAGGVAAAIGQVDRALELTGARPSGAVPSEPMPAEAAARSDPGRLGTRPEQILLGRRVRDALGPAPGPPHGAWPPVAAVCVSRSGSRAGTLVARLAETDYPALRLVVVDNASDEQAVTAAVTGDVGLAVDVVRLDSPASFAAACNAGAERCAAEFVLFINDDIDPIEPGWLRELVACHDHGGHAVVGATLVDPHVEATEAASAGGWILEQQGIGLEVEGAATAPARGRSGTDVFGPGLGVELPAVAVSAACLLIDAGTFAALGAFDSGYQFGLEDVDLCLRARARGRTIACTGRALVVHTGSSTQREQSREFRRVNRSINHRRLRQVWGPTLRRARLDGLLRGEPAWGTGPHLGIARTSSDPGQGWGDYHTGEELGEAAAALGWRVSHLPERDDPAAPIPDDLDLAVVLTDRWDARAFPAQTLMFAWVRNWTERWLTRPWLDRYDVILASSQRSAMILTEATGRPVELFPLASNPRRFHPPAAQAEPALDWAFTGNRWGQPRAIEDGLAGRRRDMAAIYGRGWEQARRLRALVRGPVAYADLPAVYGAAKVVLDDTAEPTLAYDAVNARVFDALACGTLVLSNCAPGVRELFDEEFPVWSSGPELGVQLDALLAEPERRQRLAARYRARVLGEHTYAHRVRRLRRLTGAQNQRLSFCLKVGAPDWEQAQRWGDLHLATGLGRALRRRGHRWRIEVLPEWSSPAGSGFDVAVHLRGRSNYDPAPGQLNVLWLISHPETFDDALVAGYDLVCVASAAYAAELGERVSVPVRVLEQATDPRVFFPDPNPAFDHELAFVGNSRGARRKILDDLLPTGHDLAVWGGGWDGTAVAPHVLGDHVANDELRHVYSSAAVVLCDHWPDMRAAGFRSNRVYDALACEAVVVCDRVTGLDGSLGDGVVTYADREELAPLLDRLLADPAERRRRSAGARQRIIAGETVDDRARDLLAWVTELAHSRDRITSRG